MVNIRRLETPITLNLASHSTIEAFDSGDVRMRLSSGRIVSVTDVLHVPNSRVSLLSYTRLIERGWKVDLTTTGGSVRRGNERLTVGKHGSLWSIRIGETNGTALVALPLSGPRTSLEEEHQRLGHMGTTTLKDDDFKMTSCEVCQQQKAVRPPKDQHSPRATRDGELVHVDIAGPFTASVEGNTTFLAVLDDFSKACWIVPMSSKGEALSVLQACVVKLERQLDVKVRFVRSDGGLEFASSSAKAWYDKLGIQHQLSTRYSPELNGVAERFMRTSKDMISAMVADGGLGHRYWDYAARYVEVILLKTSTDTHGVTPWEKLTKRKPNLDSIRPFGEACFVQVPSDIRRKNDFERGKAESARLLGQDLNVSGWIVRLDRDGRVLKIKGRTETHRSSSAHGNSTCDRNSANCRGRRRGRCSSPWRRVSR